LVLGAIRQPDGPLKAEAFGMCAGPVGFGRGHVMRPMDRVVGC
jgi:hypothetical protein